MKGGTFALDVLKLVYNATAIANIADNAASSPLTNLYLALHSADPGRSGSQSTSEVSYTGYARAAAARSDSVWTVSSDATDPKVSLAATQSFPACTDGTATAKFFSIGTAASSTGKILHRGVIGSFLGPFTAATSDTLTVPGLSGLSEGDQVIALSVDGSSLPTGMSAGTSYYVKTVSGDAITLSATSGGATLDITGTGDGVLYKSTPLAIVSGITPQLGTDTTVYDT